MEKVRVGYVIDRLAPGGGTENQLIQLLRNIDRERFTPIVFNLRPESYGTVDLDCEKIFLNVESITSPSTISTFFRMRKLFKTKNLDLLQLFFYDGRLLGTLAGRLAGIRPMVFCRREMGWWYTRSKLFVTRRMAALSHYCLVNANCIKELVTRTENFPADNIEVIYNGVNLNLSPPEKRPSLTQFGIPDGSPVIGVVSNFRRVKRIDRFIEVAARIKNKETHFLIIGKGELHSELEQLAKDRGIENRVHFHYTVDHTHDLISRFDIGLLSSESEGLSNVLIEYAMAGIPAAAFNVGGNPEVIADGQTGIIVENDDIEGMASRIDELMENKSLHEKYSCTARKRAEELFSVSAMVKKTEDFYLKILGRNRD